MAPLLIAFTLLLLVACVSVWIACIRLSAAVVRRQQQLLEREANLQRRQEEEAAAASARAVRADRLGSALSLGLKGKCPA